VEAAIDAGAAGLQTSNGFGPACHADQILALLETLNQEHGKTIVVVTHDPKAAEHATHTMYMDKGKLTEREA